MNDDVDLILAAPLPADVTVVDAVIEEAMSKPTLATVEIASTIDVDITEAEAAAASLTLMVGGLPERSWTLQIDGVRFLGIVEGSRRYELRLRPRLWFLDYVIDTRKFRLQTTQDIAAQIFSQNAVDTQWQITRDLDVRKYTVQYRESQLAFVTRLFELDGIFYTFEDDGVLVLGDKSSSLGEVERMPVVNLIETGGAMTWKHHGLFSIAKGARVQSGAASVNDHNWKKPKLTLLESAVGERDTDLEVYDYPVGYRRPDQGVRLAKTKLESLRVGARYVQSEANVPWFRPGRHFSFQGSTVGVVSFAGRYLLQSVTHRFHNHKFDESRETGVSYRNESRAIPDDVPFRPAWESHHPEIAGSHTAMVRGPIGEEIHTDQYGRFRVQFHWDREAKSTDEDSRWLRVMQETQTGMTLSRVGWEHSVAYINGDPDRPIGFARNINGEMVPRYAQPANKTRMTVNTPTYPQNGGYNELRLEDLAGAQHFDWQAEKDYVGSVNNNRVETVGGNETRNIMDNQYHSVDNSQDRSVGGDLDLKVGGEYPVGVGGARDVSIGGNEKFELANHTTRCEADDTETIGGNWELQVGREDKGSFIRDIAEDYKWDIGGDHEIVTDGNIRVRIDEKLTEKIGGSMLVDVSEGGSGGTITGDMISDVKGNVTRYAKDAAGFGAENADVTIQGGKSLSSDERITMRGEHIRLESTSSMKFTAANLTIELGRSKVKVKGKVKLDAASQIVATGTPMNIAK